MTTQQETLERTHEEANHIVIPVLLFSVLREKAGTSAMHVSVPAGATVSELLERVCASHPEIRPYRSVLRVGLNARYARESDVVSDGDEVALITPVSGG